MNPLLLAGLAAAGLYYWYSHRSSALPSAPAASVPMALPSVPSAEPSNVYPAISSSTGPGPIATYGTTDVYQGAASSSTETNSGPTTSPYSSDGSIVTALSDAASSVFGGQSDTSQATDTSTQGRYETGEIDHAGADIEDGHTQLVMSALAQARKNMGITR